VADSRGHPRRAAPLACAHLSIISTAPAGHERRAVALAIVADGKLIVDASVRGSRPIRTALTAYLLGATYGAGGTGSDSKKGPRS
jgi:hypothetical protein